MPGSAGKARSRPRLKRARAGVLSAVFCATLAAAGCSLDYRATEVEEKAGEGVPDTVATRLVHRVHKNGHLSMVLEASRAETFNSRKQTILSDARFEELDDAGKMATEGRAGRIVFHTDTENAEISGAVSVHSASEKAAVYASSLAWLNKEKKLSAPPADQVTIRKDDGSFIQGSGFIGDFHTRQVTFQGAVEGKYVWQEKK